LKEDRNAVIVDYPQYSFIVFEKSHLRHF